MTKKLMNMNIVEQVTQLMNNGANEQDLLAVNNWIIKRLKAIRVMKNVNAAAKLEVGMMVEWSGRRGYHKGKVIKINRTRAQVTEDYLTWNVPMHMLNIVK